jgi:hypothetical protein
MWLLDEIAERHIAQAQARGELDDLPGMGRPLPPDDMDPLVPAELRAGLRLLKNAGYLPPGAQLLGEIRDVEQLLAQAKTRESKDEAGRRLRLLLKRVGEQRGGNLLQQDAYYTQLLQQLEE